MESIQLQQTVNNLTSMLTSSGEIYQTSNKELFQEIDWQMRQLWLNPIPSDRKYLVGNTLASSVSQLFTRNMGNEARTYVRVQTEQEEVRILKHFSHPFILNHGSFDFFEEALIKTIEETAKGGIRLTEELFMNLLSCYKDATTKLAFRNSETSSQLIFYSHINKSSREIKNSALIIDPRFKPSYFSISLELEYKENHSKKVLETILEELIEGLVWLTYL
jgi:hypothetical protein